MNENLHICTVSIDWRKVLVNTGKTQDAAMSDMIWLLDPFVTMDVPYAVYIRRNYL